MPAADQAPLREPDPAEVRAALAAHPVRVAPTLLGCVLTSHAGDPVSVRITEVEAYGGVGEDPGSHAHRRRTPRNASMFGPPGHAYVYFTYGMHWCLNIVAHDPGSAGAVLIRAGEVVAGIEAARARRLTARVDRDLARGPARLAAALAVTRDLDGVDLLDPGSVLRLGGYQADAYPSSARTADPGGGAELGVGPRTGISGDGAHTPWRFWLLDDSTVSPHRPAAPRGPAVDEPASG